ncbi:MAG TPA: class I SAM-dependent methyltransferase [Verrucomicrobiota bacterium]|nr:class I SAM-dependent methyltransferase [Verrucomicrobiota bacterium]HNU51348.1 class I SAM-dependent methyltransferase [Verrucomicrobiota bacterium]
MKSNSGYRRREFLWTAGVAGVMGLLEGKGAEGEPARASSLPTRGRLMAQLESIAAEHVTIPKEEGQFLNLLVKLTRARKVLEVGTAHGYTTLWLAEALEATGGQLTTIEIVPERHELAKKHVAEAGFSHRVRFLLGDAHGLIPKIEGRHDVVYLDADKGGNGDYFEKLLSGKLPAGGLLIAHNAILLADAMQAYLERVLAHAEFETVIVRAVPEDGMALSYRRRAGRS